MGDMDSGVEIVPVGGEIAQIRMPGKGIKDGGYITQL